MLRQSLHVICQLPPPHTHIANIEEPEREREEGEIRLVITLRTKHPSDEGCEDDED